MLHNHLLLQVHSQSRQIVNYFMCFISKCKLNFDILTISLFPHAFNLVPPLPYTD